jgi:thiol-disulfide isomerase/thioredoxin
VRDRKTWGRSPGFAAAIVLLATASCGGASPEKTTVLSLERLESADAGADLAKALSAREGIHRAVFHLRRAEVTVTSDADVDVMSAAIATKPPGDGYALRLGEGHGSYRPWQAAPEGLDVKVVSEGGVDVPDLEPHKVLGKVTLIDFGAKWCEPCRMLDAHVLAYMKSHPGVAYRKLDVGDWDSPLATHYMRDVAELPFVVVFGKDGKKVAAITGLDPKKLDAAIERAAAAP